MNWDYYASGLAKARRWARAWKQSATIENKIALSALRVGKEEVSRLQARIAEMEKALRELSPLVGTMLDEEWFWRWTPDKAGWARCELGRHRCQGGDCVWKGSDDHEPSCHVSKLRDAMRRVRKVLE